MEPKSKADVDKLGMSLAKLAEEDPTFSSKKQMRHLVKLSFRVWASCTWILLLTVFEENSKSKVNQGQPQVEYKEAITASTDHREVYKKTIGWSW